MRRRKLTVDRLPYIRAVIAIRRAIPTHAELARAEGVSKSLIDQIASGVCYKEVPRETETNIQAILVELGLATPQTQHDANPG